ncbi:MAG: hypothetical protein IPP83_06335 [Flavobacteriales bacterium]|nr:hypothetical protein [Flavobacteriales bacterium]
MNTAKDLQQKLAAFIQNHPELVDELFLFTEPELRTKVLEHLKKVELHEVVRLCDRAVYLTRTRIVHHTHEAPRCDDKVIYTVVGAHAQSNRIWNTGRGRMRVYECPRCHGYHLTHKAADGSGKEAA